MQNNLNVLLAKKRMNVSELAELTDISENTLYSIRAEKAKDLRLSTVKKICNALNVTVDDFLTSEGV